MLLRNILLALTLLTASIAPSLAQTNIAMPAQPTFTELDGTFPTDGHLYNPPTADPPAFAYTPPDIPSNFRVQDWLDSTLDGIGDPAASDHKFRTTCYSAMIGRFDPILGNGRPNWGHLHEFAGNTGANPSSNYVSLRTSGGGTCGGGPINRSLYWWPAMIDGSKNTTAPNPGAVVRSFNQVVYYTNETANPLIPPNGLHYIAGYNLGDRTDSKLLREAGSAWTTINTGHAGWHCYSNGSTDTTPGGVQASFLNADGSDAMGDCHGVMYAEINFPDCWDGKNLSSPDGRSHVRYSEGPVSNGGLSNRRCPPGYYPLLQFQIKIRWIVNGYGEYRNWYLASDRMPGFVTASGLTMHSDWFGAWDRFLMNTWGARCGGATVRTGITPRPASCDYTAFGNGWRGKVDSPAPDGSSPKVVRTDLYLADDRFQPIPGVSMPGYPGMAAGMDMSMIHGTHTLKAAGQHTVH